MPTIKVKVENKIALNMTPQEQIVCHNSDYEIEFEFDAEWENHIAKTAYFVYNDISIAVPFKGNKCEVPELKNTTVCKIGVQAGDIKTTTSAYVQCKKAIVDEVGETPEPPTESVYNEIIELVNGIAVEVNGLGTTVELSVDKNYVLAVVMKNLDGDILSQSSVDLPIESLVVSAEYDNTEKSLIFTLQNGETLSVPLDDIVGGIDEEAVKKIVQETAVTQESDPTVPDWAKQTQKPTYTAKEVGALPNNTPLFSGDYEDLINKPVIPDKEIVHVDINKMITEQDVTLFMDLSNRFANGEIVIIGALNGQFAVVNAAAIIGSSANWAAVVSTWDNSMFGEDEAFNPYVTAYGFECNGERIRYSFKNMPIGEYVKFTDVADYGKAGVFFPYENKYSSGLEIMPNGGVRIAHATVTEISAKINGKMPIAPKTLDYAFKVSATTNTETWTDDEKTATRNLIGAVGDTDYANETNAGVVKVYKGNHGVTVTDGVLSIRPAYKKDIEARTNIYTPITPDILDYATMSALADCKEPELWTDDTTAEDGTVTKGTKTKACETIGATKYYLHNLTLKLGFDNQFTGDYEEMEWSCTIKSVVKGKLFGLNDNEKYPLLYKLFTLGEQNAFNGCRIYYEGVNGNNELSDISHTIIGLSDDGTELQAVVTLYGSIVIFDVREVIDDIVSEINPELI